jgi:hypothetical protein
MLFSNFNIAINSFNKKKLNFTKIITEQHEKKFLNFILIKNVFYIENYVNKFIKKIMKIRRKVLKNTCGFAQEIIF